MQADEICVGRTLTLVVPSEHPRYDIAETAGDMD